ncbi:hypothetical protein [Micromonospora globbae]|jgi:hypothetical protein|uniref:Uncharacterized protein n=1 Tax=Micromonospora globbae TaxID=1894969 RepID=A0ABZ1S0X7_9ACTN|nr:hypothetical protein [Micromonospora globbae]WTF87407.1 hypothetical protein OH732_07440 [Micromonospora globbae]
MATSRPLRLRRRGLLGVPALVAAAVTGATLRPAPAAAAPADDAPKAECLADLLGGA